MPLVKNTCTIILVSYLLSFCAYAHHPLKIAFISPQQATSGFWPSTIAFMQACADDLNIDLNIVYASSYDRKELLNSSLELMEGDDKPDFIITFFKKNTALKLLQTTEEHKIPLYSINTDLPEQFHLKTGSAREKFKYWIGQSTPNDIDAGYLMAKVLFEKYRTSLQGKIADEEPQSDSKTQILAITGARDSSTSFNRNLGLTKALLEYPEFELKQLVFSNWNTNTAYKQTKHLLLRYPNTKIIWAANDEIALAAIQGSKGKDILIAGTDWTAQALESIAKNNLHASFGGHFTEGAKALILLYDYAHGIDFIEDIGVKSITEFSRIDINNVQQQTDFLRKAHWPEIDFTLFSKKLSHIEKYNFSWTAFYNAIQSAPLSRQ